MNANELAEALDDLDLISGYKVVAEAQAMLRQQQAEIERLIGSKPITYGMLTFCKNCGEQNPYQSKTLTDEEINQVAIDMGMFGDLSHDEIELCRNVLRKSQEK